ncbi:MAG: hypothetical protein V1664_02825 [Candidatus Uhrbacteria bacterium]
MYRPQRCSKSLSDTLRLLSKTGLPRVPTIPIHSFTYHGVFMNPFRFLALVAILLLAVPAMAGTPNGNTIAPVNAPTLDDGRLEPPPANSAPLDRPMPVAPVQQVPLTAEDLRTTPPWRGQQFSTTMSQLITERCRLIVAADDAQKTYDFLRRALAELPNPEHGATAEQWAAFRQQSKNLEDKIQVAASQSISAWIELGKVETALAAINGPSYRPGVDWCRQSRPSATD